MEVLKKKVDDVARTSLAVIFVWKIISDPKTGFHF